MVEVQSPLCPTDKTCTVVNADIKQVQLSETRMVNLKRDSYYKTRNFYKTHSYYTACTVIIKHVVIIQHVQF